MAIHRAFYAAQLPSSDYDKNICSDKEKKNNLKNLII